MTYYLYLAGIAMVGAFGVLMWTIISIDNRLSDRINKLAATLADVMDKRKLAKKLNTDAEAQIHLLTLEVGKLRVERDQLKHTVNNLLKRVPAPKRTKK